MVKILLVLLIHSLYWWSFFRLQLFSPSASKQYQRLNKPIFESRNKLPIGYLRFICGSNSSDLGVSNSCYCNSKWASFRSKQNRGGETLSYGKSCGYFSREPTCYWTTVQVIVEADVSCKQPGAFPRLSRNAGRHIHFWQGYSYKFSFPFVALIQKRC